MHRSGGAVMPAMEAPPNLPVAVRHRRLSASAMKLAAAFTTALDDAVAAAITIEVRPQQSLKAFRKAVRQARALLIAVRGLLPAPVRHDLVATLRAVTRDTGAMRDRDALPAALAELPRAPEAVDARAGLEARLLADRIAGRRPLLRVRRLAVAATKLAPLSARFVAALPPRLPSGAVARGLKRMARKARRAVRAAERTPHELAAAHVARKRLRSLAAAAPLVPSIGRSIPQVARLAELVRVLGGMLDHQRLLLRIQVKGEGSPHGDRAAVHRLATQLAEAAFRGRVELLREARRLVRRRHWKCGRLSE
jgi:hypothetical protein